jgi:hypothetical protein
MTRTASCQCRGFRVVVEAEPDTVGVCHCQFCQRRTGVPLTCNAYFSKSKVRLEGAHKIYTRDCPEERKLHNYFCSTCGSTVGWTLDLRPNQFGIAVGCFNDRIFRRRGVDMGGGNVQLGDAAGGYAAFPARSTGPERELKQRLLQFVSPLVAPNVTFMWPL